MGKMQRRWFSYFGMKREPNLSIRALTKSEEMNLFVGRQSAIEELREWSESSQLVYGIITGDAGTGKTSLVCRAFSAFKGFIRIDVSKVPSFSMVPSLIAKILIDECSKPKNKKISDLMEKYRYAVKVTKGRHLEVGGGAIPAKIKSIYHETHVPFIESDAVYSIIDEALRIFHLKYKRAILVLDEADPELKKDATIEGVLAAIQAIKMPSPAILIWPVRSDVVRENWSNPRSNEKRLFDWHLHISPIGTNDAPLAGDILDKRLFASGLKNIKDVIKPGVVKDIAILADGNLREFIRFNGDILRRGAREKITLPISLKHSVQSIRKSHGEFLNSEDRRMLEYLKSYPSSASSKGIKLEFRLERRSIQDRLDSLYQRNLVVYSKQLSKSRRRQNVYRPSRKGEILLAN